MEEEQSESILNTEKKEHQEKVQQREIMGELAEVKMLLKENGRQLKRVIEYMEGLERKEGDEEGKQGKDQSRDKRITDWLVEKETQDKKQIEGEAE